MSIKTVNPAVSPNPPDPPPPLTRFQTIANTGIAGLDAIRAQLPELESPHPDTLKFAQTMKGFPRDFVDISFDLVQQTPAYQALGRFDVALVQNQLAIGDGLRPFSAAMKQMSAAIDFTIDINFARAMNQALQILQISRGLARDPGLGAALTAGVKLMEDALGRAGIRRAAKNNAQEPPAAPATPPLNAKPPLVN
jgi:hypothetical protein